MIKKINSLNSSELEQFKRIYTKYFLKEAKLTKLGFPLLFELITKKNSKAIADFMIEEINKGRYIGYSYIDDEKIVGFIVGVDDGNNPARITEVYISPEVDNRHVALELYRKIAVYFKMKGRSMISIESHLYNMMLRTLAESNFFDIVNEYPDGYVEYEKRI